MSSAERPTQQESPSEPSTEGGVIKEGSFVEVDYVLRVKDVGELVDTTLEEEARKAGVSDSSRVYEPKLVVVGRGFLLRPLEEALIGMRVEEHKSFEIPPERAFGNRDPSKVRVIPFKRLKDIDQPISVGSRIVVDGREGVVRSLGSGRVQVDFNHYLAGKTLVCDLWVKKILEDDESKVYALIHSRIPEARQGNTSIEIKKPIVTVKLPKDTYLLSGIQMAKRIISRDVLDLVSNVEKVIFVEEYEREG